MAEATVDAAAWDRVASLAVQILMIQSGAQCDLSDLHQQAKDALSTLLKLSIPEQK